jgi:hypothetical protein
MVHLELLVLQYILTPIWAKLCKLDLLFQPIKVMEFRDLILCIFLGLEVVP